MQVIVITGASSGLGEALAKRLAADGHRLVLAARRADELARVAASCGAAETLCVPTDVARRADVDALRDAAIARFGAIDVWVNNAGQGIARPTLELSDDDVDQMITVNVKSVLYAMQAVVPHFKARAPGGQGHIINVSSFLARVPLATIRSAYAAAKSAMNALTAMVRMDLARTHPGIHVSLVMPGIIATPFARNVVGAAPAAAPGASGATGAPAFTPPPVVAPQSAEVVAEAIAAVIAQPTAETYTNPLQPAVVQRYYADVGAFEAAMRAPVTPTPPPEPAR
ncbi:MAG: SDR family oxidoreductase [Myxococcota bacterium]